MNKKFFKFAAFLNAVIVTIANTVTVSAAATEMMSNQEKFEIARTQVVNELISLLRQNGYSTEKALSMTRDYAEKDGKDFLAYCTVKESYINTSVSGDTLAFGVTYNNTRFTHQGYRKGCFYNDIASMPYSIYNIFPSNYNMLITDVDWKSGAVTGAPYVFCHLFTSISGSDDDIYLDSNLMTYLEKSIDKLGNVNHNDSEKLSTYDVQKIVDHVAYNMAHLTDPNWTYHDYIIGDINGDGTITLQDALNLSLFIESTDNSLYNVWNGNN